MPTYFSELSLGAAAQTAWIFGAGASRCAPYNVPTQFSVLSRFANQPVAGATPALRQHFRDVRARLPGWVARVQPGREWTHWRVSLEELFSHYELVGVDAEALPAERDEARLALADLEFALRSATSVFGARSALKFRPFEREADSSAPYAELVESLLTGAGEHQPRNYLAIRHAFVTMNYDINLDRCLVHLDAKGLGVGIDYGFALDNARSKNAPPIPCADEPAFKLLCVHGALNWIRCTACGAVISTGHRHAVTGKGDLCGVCDAEALSSVLVHPSYTRVYDSPVIGAVWSSARRALRGAERWIFVGYSLPAADVHFRGLLRACLTRRRAAGLSTEIVLVGRRPDASENKPHPDEFDQAVEEYDALFSADLRIWGATAGGFSDFVRALRP